MSFPPQRFTEQLFVSRCPHCATTNPMLKKVWVSDRPLPRADQELESRWSAFACLTCGSVVTAKGKPGEQVANPFVWNIFPSSKVAHDDLPAVARQFLQQAYDTLHAPDAAAVMAGSAVDAMLKASGLTDGSLYSRIDKAVEQRLLTEAMGEWAHSVRLGSNRPRHADAEEPHVSPAEAKRSVEFAESLGDFLFVLTARIERGLNPFAN